MPTARELEERIEAAIPGAEAQVTTSDEVHFAARVVAGSFAGKSRIEQHRMVYDVFGAEIGGPIHSLSLTPKVTEQA